MSVNPHRQTQSIASVIWNHDRVKDGLGWVHEDPTNKEFSREHKIVTWSPQEHFGNK